MLQYTVRELEKMTRVELRDTAEIYGIKFKSKEIKDNMISAIIKVQKEENSTKTSPVVENKSIKITSLNTTFHSKEDDGYDQPMITVSSGASSGNYPVVGKKVCEVASFFTEILNISPAAKAIVNGKEVSEEYILEKYDTLEFTVQAGRKG